MISKKVKIGIIASYAYNIVLSITGFFFAPILLRLLSDSEYGLYSMFISFFNCISVPQLVIEGVLVRFIAKASASKDAQNSPEKIIGGYMRILSIAALLFAVLGAVFVLNVPNFYAGSLTADEVSKLVIVYALALALKVVSLPLCVFVAATLANESFAFYNIVLTVAAVLTPLSSILAVRAGHSSVSLAAINTMVNFLVMLSFFLYSRYKLRLKPRFVKFEASQKREAASFVWFQMLITLVGKVNWNLGTVLLGGTLGTFAAKGYSLGLQFGSYFTIIAATLNTNFLPNLTRIGAGSDESEIRRQYTELLILVGRAAFALMGISAAFMIVLGRDFLRLWAASDNFDTYLVLVIIIIPALLELALSLGYPMLQALGKHSYQAKISTAATIFGLCASLLLSRSFGIVGYAAGVAGALLLTVVGYSICYQKKIGLDMVRFWKELSRLMLPFAGSVAISLLCVGMIKLDGIFGFLVKTVVFGCGYIGLMWFVGLKSEEKRAALGWIKNKLKKKKRQN